MEPGFCLHYSFTPKPPFPVSPGPEEGWGAAQGSHPMACEPAQPTAPAEHTQLDLRCLIPVKSSGCPETRGSREESWPVV